MPHELPELPSRPQPTKKQVTLQPLRVPQISSPETSGVAAIFASVLKGAGELAESTRRMEDKINESYLLDMPVSLAEVAQEISDEPELAKAEGREPREENQIIRDRFAGSLEIQNAAIRERGRLTAEPVAADIRARWEANRALNYREEFKAARDDPDVYPNDPLRKEGYLEFLAESEIELNKRLKAADLAQATGSLSVRVGNDIEAIYVAGLAVFENPNRPDGATFTTYIEEAQKAAASRMFNKTLDQLSPAAEAVVNGEVATKLQAVMTSSTGGSDEAKLEALQSLDVDELSLSVTSRRELKELKTELLKVVAAGRNAETAKTISNIKTQVTSTNTIDRATAISIMLDPIVNRRKGKEALFMTVMGEDGLRRKIREVDRLTLLAVLRKHEEEFGPDIELEDMLTVRKTSQKIGPRHEKAANRRYKQYITEGMPPNQASERLVREFDRRIITKLMIADISESRAEDAAQTLDAWFAIDPNIRNMKMLTKNLAGNIKVPYDMGRYGDQSIVQIANTFENAGIADDFTNPATAIERTAAVAFMKKPRGGFFGIGDREYQNSLEASALFMSEYDGQRILGRTHQQAVDLAFEHYEDLTVEMYVNKRWHRIVINLPIDIEVDPDSDRVNAEAIRVTDEQGLTAPAMIRIQNILDYHASASRMAENEEYDLQNPRLTPDKSGYIYDIYLVGRRGRADRPVRSFTVARSTDGQRRQSEALMPSRERERLDMARDIQAGRENVFGGQTDFDITFGLGRKIQGLFTDDE